MAVAVTMPELGESVVEGTISRWLVKEGERVERDQPLVEVTTDKVDAEIPSPEAGVLAKILVPEGETVEVGAELARIEPGGEATAGEEPGEKAKKEDEPEGRPEAKAKEKREARPAQEERREAPRAEPERERKTKPTPEDEPRATPVARRMAEEREVDLSAVEGSGVAGRVTKRDLERRAERPAAREPEPARAASTRPAAQRRATPWSLPEQGRPPYLTYQLQPGDRVIQMTPLRRIVAEHMVLSKRISPHVGTVAEVDLGRVVRLRERNKRAFQEAHGFSLTYLPFVVHATVRALREFPRLNASVVEDTIIEKQAIHVGIAVETEKGLVVPVIRHADRLSLTGLATAVEDLSERARTKQLSADELKGGTFTVSNPGRRGNLYGFAIINQPQVGILRMGEIVKRPVVRPVEGEDAIVIRPIMHLALSYDHRAVDGAPANAFLYRVRELLEEGEFDL